MNERPSGARAPSPAGSQAGESGRPGRKVQLLWGGFLEQGTVYCRTGQAGSVRYGRQNVCATGRAERRALPAGSRDSRRAAFTLIEVVISSALMALILTSGYVCLNAAISSQKAIEPRVEIFQNARVAMSLMTADLRNACPLSKEYDFLGMHRMLGEVPADNIDFGTHNYTPKRPGEGDFCQTSVFLEQAPNTGLFTLWRRRNPRIGLNPLSGGSREEIATGLRGLKFEYYDGFEWYDTWGDAERRGKAQSSNRQHYNLEGLPEAVRITLWFDSNPKGKQKSESPEETPSEPPMVFQTVVRLESADLPTASASRSSFDTGQPQTPPQPADQPTQ